MSFWSKLLCCFAHFFFVVIAKKIILDISHFLNWRHNENMTFLLFRWLCKEEKLPTQFSPLIISAKIHALALLCNSMKKSFLRNWICSEEHSCRFNSDSNYNQNWRRTFHSWKIRCWQNWKISWNFLLFSLLNLSRAFFKNLWWMKMMNHWRIARVSLERLLGISMKEWQAILKYF